MSACTDFALYDNNSRLVALVQARAKAGTSDDWAAKFRCNLLAHGTAPQADFFVVATTDRIYLWKTASGKADDAYPDYSADASGIFLPYFEKTALDPGVVHRETFKIIVSSWLAGLIYSENYPDENVGDQRWLFESGFFSAVREGRIEYDAAA